MSTGLLGFLFGLESRGSRPQLVMDSWPRLQSGASVAWSPAGATIAVGDAGGVHLRDAQTGALLRQWKWGGEMAWSPDSTALVTRWLPDVQHLNEQTLRMWDAETGEPRCTYRGFFGHLYTLTWSPDGTRIAAGTADAGEPHIHVWDARDGTPLWVSQGHPHSSSVTALVWSQDSSLLVARDTARTIQIRKSADGMLVHQLPVPGMRGAPVRSRVESVMRALATVKAASPVPTSTFWEALSEAMLTDHLSLSLWLSGGWSPDGCHLAIIDGERVVVFNWQTGKPERTYGGHLRDKPVFLVPPKTRYGPVGLSWSPDGQRIASVDARGQVHVWPVFIRFPWLPSWPSGAIQAVAFP